MRLATATLVLLGLLPSAHGASTPTTDCGSDSPRNAAWNELVCAEASEHVPDLCQSSLWLPESGAAQGLVVLMHGYTACPEVREPQLLPPPSPN
jgi:hypothetical protein